MFPYQSLILFDCDIDLGNLYFMLQLLNRYCWIGQAAPNNTPLWSERGVLAVKGRYPQMYVSTVKYIIVWLNPKNWLKQLFLAPNLTLQVIEWSLITRLYIYFD